MREIESRLVGAAPDGRLRIKVRWQFTNGWLARLLWKFPKHSEVDATYVGSGTVWYITPGYHRVSTSLESRLADIAVRLLAHSAGASHD